MIPRKYAGLAFGLVLSMILASAVAADIIGPNHISNASPGWNSIQYADSTSNTTTASIRWCSSSDVILEFELMRHWFGLPSTGMGKQNVGCQFNSTWRPMSWSVSAGDYSLEYTPNNPATISTDYQIVY